MNNQKIKITDDGDVLDEDGVIIGEVQSGLASDLFPWLRGSDSDKQMEKIVMLPRSSEK